LIIWNPIYIYRDLKSSLMFSVKKQNCLECKKIKLVWLYEILFILEEIWNQSLMFSDKNMVAITNLKCQTPNVRSNSSFLPFSKRWIWLRNAEEESNPGGLYLLLIAGASIPECEQILIPSFFLSFDLVLPGGRGRGYIGNRKHWLMSPAYKKP